MGFAFLSTGGSSAAKSTTRGSLRNLAFGALVLGMAFGGCSLETTGMQEQTCTVDSQCDDLNPCTIDRCGGAGICEHAPTTDGVLPPAQQIPGDCTVTQCTAGAVVPLPDDSDKPDDGDPCTKDDCSNGTPVFDPQGANGHGCIVDGGQGMCVDGACVPTLCTPDNEATLCPDDNVCTDDSCNTATGQCVHPPASDGPAPDQTTGDCLLVMCAGGVLQTVIDNGDVPVDGLQCTDDVCNSGTPANPPLTVGTHCDQSGGTVCDDTGACVACNQPADCVLEDPDNECRTRTCSADHQCGMDYVPPGQPLANQFPGNCLRRECDGAGTVIDVADDSDLPDDSNDCTNDLCNSGTPSHTNKGAGAPCGSSQVCDSSGHCGCGQASDCGSGTQCMSWTCDSLFCTQHFQADGYAVPSGQIPADCHQIECDGAGNEQNRIHDADVPVDDGKQCTNETCSNGVAQHPAKPINTSCSQTGGSYCDDNGDCVQCNGAAQCSDPQVSCMVPACNSQVCGTTFASAGTAPAWQQTANDCKIVNCDGNGNASTANLDLDVPLDDGNQCTNEACSSGVPQHPPKLPEAPCNLHPGWVCNGSASNPACVECATNNQCVSPNTCDTSSWTCLCTPTTCGALGLTCGTSVSNGCSGNLNCDSGAQDGAETDVDCGGDAATCPDRCNNGQNCLAGTDCTSAICQATDHKCCNNACTGACRSCLASQTGGADGTCGNIPFGQDPDNECDPATNLGVCNGTSGCATCGQSAPAVGGSCPAACTGGCASNICRISCTANDSCQNTTIACPAGWACRVNCTGNNTCNNSTINCPDLYACSVRCNTGSGTCAATHVNCSALGPCDIQCSGSSACNGPPTVTCGGNQCQATCANGSGKPTLTCGTACTCTSCP